MWTAGPGCVEWARLDRSRALNDFDIAPYLLIVLAILLAGAVVDGARWRARKGVGAARGAGGWRAAPRA